MLRTKYFNFGRLWEITHEPSQLELTFLHAALLPNAFYNLTKFHENSSKGIGVMGRSRFRLQTDGQTDAGAIAISPEPIGRGIKTKQTFLLLQNGSVQRVKVEESARHKWIKYIKFLTIAITEA